MSSVFPDYWVYFKAEKTKPLKDNLKLCFQTIESILKRRIRIQRQNQKTRFPDYWVYFKAEQHEPGY